MNMRTIREAVRSQPFHPFVLRMNDGRKFTVGHPESLALGKRVLVFVDPDTDESIWLEPILIASLHKPKKNGRKKP
jgi:hypothetical protein